MPVSYATVIYPSIGASGGKSIKTISDVTADFMKAINTYLDHEKIIEKQGIRVPGLNKATEMVTKAKKAAGTNDLTVRGGLDGSGNLVLSVSGILPPKKSGGQGEKYDKSEIVRPGFKALLEEMKSETNVVVNMTKISLEEAQALVKPLYEKYGNKAAVENSSEYAQIVKKYKGDDIINRASEKQALKYGVTAQKDDEHDFGGVTTGTVVLCAHGGAAAVSGLVVGTGLGHRTPQQLVDILTANSDKAKNLSPKFSGVVHLSGCFTATGDQIPKDYDYSNMAMQVLKLLQGKGFKNITVRGHPGPATTKDDGGKTARHASTTTQQAEAFAQQMTAIEKLFNDRVKELKNDKEAIQKDPKILEYAGKWQKVKAERAEVLKIDDNSKKMAQHIDGLVGNFGLRVR